MASRMLMKGYRGLQSKTWLTVLLEEGFPKSKACDEGEGRSRVKIARHVLRMNKLV